MRRRRGGVLLADGRIVPTEDNAYGILVKDELTARWACRRLGASQEVTE